MEMAIRRVSGRSVARSESAEGKTKTTIRPSVRPVSDDCVAHIVRTLPCLEVRTLRADRATERQSVRHDQKNF